MTLAVSSKCSEHSLLAQECVKASLAMLTNTSHLSWRADLVILEENICETTVLKFLLERDQKYDCCNRPRSTLACLLFSWICLILLMCILVKRKYLFDSVFVSFTVWNDRSSVCLGASDACLRNFLCMYLTLIGQQKVNGADYESRRFDMDYEL